MRRPVVTSSLPANEGGGATLHADTWAKAPPRIAEGVLGYTFTVFRGTDYEETWIPLLLADPPGKGHVGRYLTSLSGGRTAVVLDPSALLIGMLKRRGWKRDTRTILGNATIPDNAGTYEIQVYVL